MKFIRLYLIPVLPRLIIIFLLALASRAGFAAGVPDELVAQYSSRTWQTDEGLPENQVQAITQTPDGYLWVGTRDGLARFDGITFTRFDEKQFPEMKNPYVDALCTDRNGALWIGTFGGLVCTHDGMTRLFTTTNGLVGNKITVLYEGRDGSIWIGTTTGASRYKNGTFTNYDQKRGLLADLVNSIYEDRDGNVWIATVEGLNRLRGEVINSFSVAEGLPTAITRGICQDKSGRLWVGSNKGLTWFEGGKFHVCSAEDRLSDGFINYLFEDSRSNLWVGTFSGLNRSQEGRHFTELNNAGIPFDKVNALFEDREGNLWVGSREGLIRLSPKQFLAYTRREGLSHNNIMSVMEDHEGSLWLGTWGGGLDQLKDGKITVYSTANGFPHDLILSICEGRDGSLWVGTDYEGGLIQLKQGKSKLYTWKDGLIKGELRVIHEDRSGNIWIGTSKGLSCFKDGKFTNYTSVRDHLAGNFVWAICEDHAGNLWFGTEGGISRWLSGQFTNFTTRDGLSENAVIALYEDKQNTLWIGTLGGGLNRYQAGRFTAYTTQQGLFSDDAFEILEDKYGYLWMTCLKGVYRVLKQDLNHLDVKLGGVVACVSYGKSDGMESAQCNGVGKPAGWKTRDGRLWFPTTKGVVVAEPNLNLKPKELPPPVYITEIIADNQKVALGEWPAETVGRGGKKQRAKPGEAKLVPPGRGEFEFHYTALSLSASEKNRFKYKLEGIDSDWVDAGTRRLAHYNNLYPGHYRFRVIGCNDEGVWNETGAVAAFVLRPHFWQTWWFLTLAGLTVVGLVGSGVRYFAWQKLRRKLALLELQNSLEKERSRIARDIHDDLGATLTQITLLSELTQRESSQPQRVVQHTVQIARTARELVQAMDEIVWAINPQNDNLPRVASYIFQYAEKFFSGTSLRCRFDSPDDLPAQTLTAEGRHHLFLVTKEAMNNVARHADATEVWFRLRVVDSELCLCVEDNGKGLTVESLRQFGNGLNNMRNRMEEIGGTFKLESTPGMGTKIRLKLKFQP